MSWGLFEFLEIAIIQIDFIVICSTDRFATIHVLYLVKVVIFAGTNLCTLPAYFEQIHQVFILFVKFPIVSFLPETVDLHMQIIEKRENKQTLDAH